MINFISLEISVLQGCIFFAYSPTRVEELIQKFFMFEKQLKNGWRGSLFFVGKSEKWLAGQPFLCKNEKWLAGQPFEKNEKRVAGHI